MHHIRSLMWHTIHTIISPVWLGCTNKVLMFDVIWQTIFLDCRSRILTATEFPTSQTITGRGVAGVLQSSRFSQVKEETQRQSSSSTSSLVYLPSVSALPITDGATIFRVCVNTIASRAVTTEPLKHLRRTTGVYCSPTKHLCSCQLTSVL